ARSAIRTRSRATCSRRIARSRAIRCRSMPTRSTCCPSRRPSRLDANASAERAVQERQAPVHPVIDAGMRAVELPVDVRDAVLREALRQDPRAVVNAVLIAPSAVDEDAAQRLELFRMARDEIHRIVLQPAPPALGNQLAGLEIERHSDSLGLSRIGIV